MGVARLYDSSMPLFLHNFVPIPFLYFLTPDGWAGDVEVDRVQVEGGQDQERDQERVGQVDWQVLSHGHHLCGWWEQSWVGDCDAIGNRHWRHQAGKTHCRSGKQASLLEVWYSKDLSSLVIKCCWIFEFYVFWMVTQPWWLSGLELVSNSSRHSLFDNTYYKVLTLTTLPSRFGFKETYSSVNCFQNIFDWRFNIHKSFYDRLVD